MAVDNDILSITGTVQTARWNTDAPLGTPVVVTYSFNSAPASYDSTARPSFTAFSEAQKNDIRQALDVWAAASGISFIEVPEAVGGQIRFNMYDMTGQLAANGQQAAGLGYNPYVQWTTVNGTKVYSLSYNTLGGDVFLNAALYAGNDVAMSPTHGGYSVTLHEIGHALGFKHPFEGTPTIDPAHDNATYTVMSYNRPNTTVSLGTVDVAASQYYYGTADIPHSFNAATLTVTFNGTGASEWILGTELKDVIYGGGGDDHLRGELGNDTLAGGAGNDTLTGGVGDDLFVFGPSDGSDIITDFVAGAHTDDRIDLSAFHTTLAHALGHASQSGADTVFNFGNGDTLTLQSVTKANLNLDDFIGVPNKAVNDFNGDARSDLMTISNAAHTVFEWQMNGTQISASVTVGTINAAAGWNYIGNGDFNGDGKTDMLFINSTTHGVAEWLLDGGQVTANPQIGTYNAAGGWSYTGTGDFNGDGKTDLLFLNSMTHGVAVWQIDGTQVTANPQIGTINATAGWGYAGNGDFNGDGKTDLLFLNSTTNGVAIWQMDGTQVTASPQIGTIAAGWHFATTGDFNGDGKTDLLMLNDTTHGVAIWQMDGTQVTANPQIGTIATGWHFQDTGDFNGDGKTDLLFLNDTTHGVAIWQMNGTQVAANPQIGVINAAAGWHFDAVRDLSGDGKSDLVFENGSTGGVASWVMDGTQVTSNAQFVIYDNVNWHLTV
ncbi:VCBS repeat-containing protein [Bradyrhizobium jicamae]|uniref:FG-GAP-like repeat-containing protein n=1 Tax=Bradyrhizobium jicamae TaxID=280332 RepID=UPI001BAA135C|nr:FG-GAP-like repeat-containing protein [Bradyrhizobium jicamae]MBR0757879.1 VCBS repeat-containing protein [Bradyrhizobium jicamae]